MYLYPEVFHMPSNNDLKELTLLEEATKKEMKLLCVIAFG